MSDQPGPDQPVPDPDRGADPVVDLDRADDVEIDLTAFLPEGVVIDARGDVPPAAAPDEVANGTGPGTDVSVEAPPPGQGAPAEQDEVDVALLDALEQDLEAVEAALRSLDDGTYGTCVVCRTVLAADVLAADPVRRTCPEHG